MISGMAKIDDRTLRGGRPAIAVRARIATGEGRCVLRRIDDGRGIARLGCASHQEEGGERRAELSDLHA